MKVLGKVRRRRWLAVAALTATLGTAAYAVSGVTGTAAPAPQASPVVDRDYIYGQLFTMAYSDVYRVSGADGPPTDASSPWNQPSTVNGWQEFFQHWKDQLTDEKVMSPIAKFATVTDHYFHRAPEQRTNAIFDHHAGIDLGGQLSDDLEIKLRRGDPRQIAWVGKEGPALLDTRGNDLRGPENMDRHPRGYHT